MILKECLLHCGEHILATYRGGSRIFEYGIYSNRAEGEYDGSLTSSSTVKLYLNSYTHTHNIHFRSIYELKYWHKGKYRALKNFYK